MIKKKKLAVPYPTIFIVQLPESTQRTIHDDLEQYAKETGNHLSWDPEISDYTAMSGRFCDIEEIYNKTILQFCQPGEDV